MNKVLTKEESYRIALENIRYEVAKLNGEILFNDPLPMEYIQLQLKTIMNILIENDIEMPPGYKQMIQIFKDNPFL